MRTTLQRLTHTRRQRLTGRRLEGQIIGLHQQHDAFVGSPLVEDAHHCTPHDARNALDHGLVQLGIDVVLPPNDHVLGAPEQHDASIIQAHQIPGVMRLHRRGAEISGKQMWRAHHQFAGVAHGCSHAAHRSANNIAITRIREFVGQ